MSLLKKRNGSWDGNIRNFKYMRNCLPVLQTNSTFIVSIPYYPGQKI